MNQKLSQALLTVDNFVERDHQKSILVNTQASQAISSLSGNNSSKITNILDSEMKEIRLGFSMG